MSTTTHAPIETRPIVQTASPSAQHRDPLLDEITHLHANLPNLTPAAVASLRTVLQSILHESNLPRPIAAAARQLLRELAAAPSPQPEAAPAKRIIRLHRASRELG